MAEIGNPVDRSLGALIRNQGGLITRNQVLSAGMTRSALYHRLRDGGRWSPVLPGVYLSYDGYLTAVQREMAAILYAGRDGVVTGNAALVRHGMQAPAGAWVDVLLPIRLRRQSTGFVVIHRTRRMPAAPILTCGIRYAPPARAVADAVRAGMDARAARALVASAVQRRRCTIEELVAELREGPPWGSGPLREALTDVLAGNRSVAEGDLRRLIVQGGLPTPLYNPRLLVGSAFLACPDAWWPEAGVACEVDSAEWHLSPEDWKKTQARHARMSAHGIIVLHYAPSRIRTQGETTLAELRSAIDNGRRRPPLPITTIPAATIPAATIPATRAAS